MLTSILGVLMRQERRQLQRHRKRFYLVTFAALLIAVLAPVLFLDTYIWPITTATALLVFLLRLAVLVQERCQTQGE